MRGFGYSSMNTQMGGLSELAEDLKLFVTEVLKIDKFYVIGH